MRHRVAGRRLGRNTKQRKHLRRNLITELFRHGKIRTTEAKAKAVRSQAEKLITLARNRGDSERLIDLIEEGDEATLRRCLTTAQADRLLRLYEADDAEGLEREARAIAVHAQRRVARELYDRGVLYSLFHDIAPRYWNRPGGYTRIVRIGPRKGDAAEMVYLMLVEGEEA